VATFTVSSIRAIAQTSPRTVEDAETRPSSGYDKPRQPDASDLRAATFRRDQFFKHTLNQICKQRAGLQTAFRDCLKEFVLNRR